MTPNYLLLLYIFFGTIGLLFGSWLVYFLTKDINHH